MNRIAPKLRAHAQRLIAYEMSRNASSKSTTTSAFVAIGTLGLHFGALMGAAGFRALISRALVLASAEVAWLHNLRFSKDGSFEGLNELEVQANPEEIANGGIVLLAQLLRLLVTFIGEDLTFRLLCDINDLKSGQKD